MTNPPPEHCSVDNAQFDPGSVVFRITAGGSVITLNYCQVHWTSLGMDKLNSILSSIGMVNVVKDLTYNPDM